jgi:hypothetical protein
MAGMVFDLGKAMRKKEEFESARLMDFEFRQRVRATRLLARRTGADEAWLVSEIAVHPDEAMLDALAERIAAPREALAAAYRECLTEARRQLIGERGDPSPHRLG